MSKALTVCRTGCRAGAVLAAALIFAAHLVFSAPAAAQDTRPVGHVIQQIGPVTAMQAKVPRSLRLGAPLYQGDWIATAPASRVRIEMTDGSVLSLGANSRVEIDTVAYSAEGRGLGGVLKLIYGILRSALAGPVWRDGFSVETRAAVASVRSTDFIAEATPDKTAVFVVEGRVEVAPARAPAVMLEGGQGVDVPLDATGVEVKTWGQARVDDAIARTRVP